jgi:hypothetical protein
MDLVSVLQGRCSQMLYTAPDGQVTVGSDPSDPQRPLRIAGRKLLMRSLGSVLLALAGGALGVMAVLAIVRGREGSSDAAEYVICLVGVPFLIWRAVLQLRGAIEAHRELKDLRKQAAGVRELGVEPVRAPPRDESSG